MEPKVLAKYAFGLDELPNDSDIEIHNAELSGYKKYQVKDEFYPAIIPQKDEKVVGKLVFNLTDDHIAGLDEYEGDEYVRKPVSVYDVDGKRYVQAECYIWIDKIDRLIEC